MERMLWPKMDVKFTTTFTHHLVYNVVTTTLHLTKRGLYCLWMSSLSLTQCMIKTFSYLFQIIQTKTLLLLLDIHKIIMISLESLTIAWMEGSTFLRIKKVVTTSRHYSIVLVVLMKLDIIVQSTRRNNFWNMLNMGNSKTKSILPIDLVELSLWVLVSQNGSQSLILD